MPALPVGENHYPRTLLADQACDLQPVLPGVLDPAVGDVERVAVGDLQNLRSLGGFVSAVLRRAARPHFSLGEIENAGAKTALRHLEQRAATGLFDVVAMGGDGQDVE